MKLDTLNRKYKVVSKYFTGKTVMDESLTDFQEKKSFKVLKNNKTSTVKPKVKKVKPVRGQKDIRTALKPNKNELIAYSEDFDSVCKKSGIDVDSEQLQLAIALSKSLQTTASTDSITSCSKSLTAQQRTGLIRTTLKEYGFKVPEKPNPIRKTKKRRKPYKLLLTGDEEKQQIITDRYTQRLFELNNLKRISQDRDLPKPNLLLYNMTTNIQYEDIKEDSVFYVESLIEKSPNSMGCLLKKWSDIPGRPLSPHLNKSELIFSEIECSQDEMDIVLSGSLKYSKEILQKKNLCVDRGKSTNCNRIEKDIDKTLLETDPTVIEEYDDNQASSIVLTVSSDSGDGMNNSGKPRNTTISLLDNDEKNLLVVIQPSRSLSPDLFDGEDDTVVESPVAIMTETIIKPADSVTKEASESMDLTECVHIISQKCINNTKYIEPVSQLSHVDVTKRKSNDFMEMTECVGGTSQPMWEKKDEEIDLTGQCEEIVSIGKSNSAGTDNMKIKNIVGPSQPILKNIIDLTTYYGNNTEIAKNGTSNKNTETTDAIGNFLLNKIDKPIDLTGHYVNNVEMESNIVNEDNIEHMDLTQSSNSSTDTLPIVHISGKQTEFNKSLEDTIIINENDYFETKSPDLDTDIIYLGSKQINQCAETKTNTEGDIAIIPPTNVTRETDETPIISLDETCEVPLVHNNIDFTQKLYYNETSNNEITNSSIQINHSSLGKRDNVSVDYDEALEIMNSFPYYTHEENCDNSTELIEKHSPNNDKTIFSNDRLSTLELTENEFKSPNKTNNIQNHFEFGGISIIDNLPSFNRKSRNTMNSIPNGSMSDSLPVVNLKGRACPEKLKSPIALIELLDPILDSVYHQSITNEKQSNSGRQTPKNKVDRRLNIETPEQSKYIVKTDNVTPMLDYTSMSTPERNRELDKYGLKPFKRKRAIQLLTHLYNQTHPYVESTEELTLPSKKLKKDDESKPSSSKSSSTSLSPRNKSKSPRKTSKSPRKHSSSPRKGAGHSENLDQLDKENDLFTVTSEVPSIRNVECDADDWVFQKREKAKLHSCRVPLHIAFHNYMSCRRHLQEAILRYEPVNIDIIHKELAASGHRYDPKDLLKFMDKKCITVKTADNSKNNKRY